MTQPPPLSEALDTALTAPGTTTASSGDLIVEVDTSDVDRLGVVIDAIRVRGGRGSVTERAARVAEGVTPSGQPLVPVAFPHSAANRSESDARFSSVVTTVMVLLVF